MHRFSLRSFRKSALAGVLAVGLSVCVAAPAQSLDDLGIQLHGYATQGFLYTTNNNIFTTASSDGSPEWTEAVLNISATPSPKLRVALQARYELFGGYSNEITIDYAAVDYKASDRFGVRFGKVKVPAGLFNETQNIDPSYTWILLPQSVYPLPSRNGQLSLYGGVVYGVWKGGKFGKLEYRGWGGETVLAWNDGYLNMLTEEGIAFPRGLAFVESGVALHWKTPVPGFMIGASDTRKNNFSDLVTSPTGGGTLIGQHNNVPAFFAQYDAHRIMVAFEGTRLEGNYALQYAAPAVLMPYDTRRLYAMATYKVTGKFTAGVYDSQFNNHSPGTPLGPGKYSKDWAVSARYDFSQFIYAKAEQHFIDGTAINYDVDLNPGGLKPTTRLTVLKIGTSF